MITKAELIQQVIKKHSGLTTVYIPYLDLDFQTFSEYFDLDVEEIYNTNKYINSVSDADKMRMFTSLGFTPCYMTTDILKMIHFTRTGFDDNFIEKKANYFILSCSDFSGDSIYFLLEYGMGAGALADLTIDWDKLEEDKKQQDRIREILGRNKNKETSNDNPY
ncbi:hypothetical protein LIS04_170 [Listeria phage LIS04]|nr:hypothetical protein LIS04_170 [Listeria phage LIS04]